MTIADVRIEILRARLKDSIRMSFGALDYRTLALIRIDCENGMSGYGESWINYPPWAPRERKATVEEGIAPLLRGQNAVQINRLHTLMIEELLPMARQSGAPGPLMQAISGVDLALWDLLGKRHGISVSDMLGGRVRDRIPAYASGLGPDRVEDLAVLCRERGFRAVKLRVGFGTEVDEANLKLVRRLLGQDAKLFVDANQAWDLPEALESAEIMSKYNVAWVEEPIRGNRLQDLEAFSRRTGLAVATGENLYGSQEFFSYAASPLVSLLQPDVSKTGGITEAMRVCHLAAAAGKRVAFHLYSGPIAQAATLQAAACLPQTPHLEFDIRPNPLCEGLLSEIPVLEDGMLEVPLGAGLGVTVNPSDAARFSVARVVGTKPNPDGL